MAPETSERASYPLYATTFTVHRVAPLFHGDITIDNAALRLYASQFRDILTGEVLRGVRVGLVADDEALARVGALRNVHWSLLRDEEEWQAGVDETRMTEDDTSINEKDPLGILAEIRYEKATYSAILLQNTGKTGQEEVTGFSHYPLLLTRMPGYLKETFLSFLATTFDTRASVIKLSPQFLTETFEKYLADITAGESGPLESVPASRALQTIIRDILITLSFDNPGSTTSLRTMDITIPKEDTWRMMTRGRKLLEIEERRSDINHPKSHHPFTKALTHYIDGHLALKLDNPSVNISRIACGAFVLGAEGKIKLSAPPNVEDGDDVQSQATKALVAGLIELAKGGKAIALADPPW